MPDGESNGLVGSTPPASSSGSKAKGPLGKLAANFKDTFVSKEPPPSAVKQQGFARSSLRSKEAIDDVEQTEQNLIRASTLGNLAHLGDQEEALEEASRPQHITDRKLFTGVIATCILANAVQMGVETDNPEPKAFYAALEHLFTAIFLVEMCLKLYFERKLYFHSYWNCMDCCLVLLSVFDVWLMEMMMGSTSSMSNLSVLRMLRVLRIARMIRLLRVFKELWLIIKGMIDSVKTIFWASLLMVMLLYVFGIFCCQTIGQNSVYYRRIDETPADQAIDYHPDFDAYEMFGTVPRAMFTLFETCLEPLNVRPVVEKQPAMFIFFLFFIFLTTFGVMNVIIGVIVDKCMEASKSHEEDFEAMEKLQKLQMIPKIRNACFAFDQDNDGEITVDEVLQALSNPVIMEIMQDVDLPFCISDLEFFDLLDASGTGRISHLQMMRNIFRTILQGETRHLLDMKIQAHAIHRTVRLQSEEQEFLTERVEKMSTKLNIDGGRLVQVEQRMRDLVEGMGMLKKFMTNHAADDPLQQPSAQTAENPGVPRVKVLPVAPGEKPSAYEEQQRECINIHKFLEQEIFSQATEGH